jgi:hypothetical protein
MMFAKKPWVLALSLLVLVPVVALAQGVSAYVVHGVPGLEVDVYVVGEGTAPSTPLLKSFKFKDIVGPVNVAEGKYDIYIYPAGVAPSNPPALKQTAEIPARGNFSIVAHLNGAGAPTVSFFENDVDQSNRLIPDRYLSRVAVRHTAAAPDVFFKVNRLLDASLTNGQQVRLTSLQPGNYTVSLAPVAAPMTDVFGPVTLRLDGRTLYNIYAVGSVANDTFAVLVQPIVLPVE